MEEKEVIQYLKDNFKKGISLRFNPKEVQDWIMKNYRDCLYLNDDGVWDKSLKHITGTDDIWANDVYALIGDYEPKEPEAGWVEFEIDKNGYYRIRDIDMRLHWSEWNRPLWFYGKDEFRGWHLTAFGGWQYKDCNCWWMSPKVVGGKGIFGDNGIYREYYVEDKICGNYSPAIPVKIRFWKEK